MMFNGFNYISAIYELFIVKFKNYSNIYNCPFVYNKEVITIDSINAFKYSGKKNNDKNNKIRENIIGAIINNNIPKQYYSNCLWNNLKKEIYEYINKLHPEPYNKIECLHKGGRKFNFDFNIIFYYSNQQQPQSFNIELKYNASTIDEAPQFVSPMQPSQYMSNSYEEMYYEKYLPELSAMSGLPVPLKKIYLQQVHSNKPKCIEKYQELYYNGCSQSSKFTNKPSDIVFYEFSKKISNQSIIEFINKTELNSEKLSTYLQNTQQNKIYMLYSNKKFNIQYNNIDDYTIINTIKNSNKFRYECLTKSGKSINILLRWKNGNGIAFPAFQIS